MIEVCQSAQANLTSHKMPCASWKYQPASHSNLIEKMPPQLRWADAAA
jgi:hypothetical protein